MYHIIFKRISLASIQSIMVIYCRTAVPRTSIIHYHAWPLSFAEIAIQYDCPCHRLLELEFQPCVSKQRIAWNPSLHPRSYEHIRPESASSPVVSDKRGQWIFSKTIAHFSDHVHIWRRLRQISHFILGVNKHQGWHVWVSTVFLKTKTSFIKVSWFQNIFFF